MRKESYLLKPQEVEVHAVKNGTDIILRKNIEKVKKDDAQEETSSTYECWECDEAQYRYHGIAAQEDVESRFDYWLAIAEGADEMKAVDEQAKADGEPTVMERLDALESGLAELAEVMCNG